MPELPEVEFCAQRLREWLVGHRIESVWAMVGTPLRDCTPSELQSALAGVTITEVHRHGKQLFLESDGPNIIWVHLGMTGKWVTVESDFERRWTRVLLRLEGGQRIAFVDQRRFGGVRISLKMSLDERLERGGLGPDALAAADLPGVYRDRLHRSASPIKVALLDQRTLAGIGNIYACDALYDAGVHPETPANELSDVQLAALGNGVKTAMRASIAREVGEEINYLQEAKS